MIIYFIIHLLKFEDLLLLDNHNIILVIIIGFGKNTYKILYKKNIK